MKEVRSGIAPENLQEVLDASADLGNALNGGQQQYCTPPWLADQCNARLPNSAPRTVFDPQCGESDLINVGSWATDRFGWDIDNRKPSTPQPVTRVTGHCVKIAEGMDDMFPDLHFECANANPPFGRKWTLADGTTIDSTEWTWKLATSRANYGYFISNHNTMEKLGISKHPWVFHYEVKPAIEIWKGVRDTLMIGIAFWKRPEPKEVTKGYAVSNAFDNLQVVSDQEKVKRPPYNIYLDPKRPGYLRTYLSFRSEVKLKLTREQIARLHRLNETNPFALTTDRETRDLLKSLVTCGTYTIQPEAKEAIEFALREVWKISTPIMPVTDFESVAYADEEETLECHTTVNTTDYQFTAGTRYKINTGTHKFVQTWKRRKPHYDEKSMATFTMEHECQLSGQDRYIRVTDDRGKTVRFMDKPQDKGADFPEADLWKVFSRPAVKTVAEVHADLVAKNLAILKSCSLIAGFEYYPGQLEYLARVAVKDCGLVGAATGTGKTLMAISLLAMKTPERALIIAPQGTMKSSEVEEDEDAEEYNASQWIQEINRFAPELQIWEIFSPEDYERICSLNKGQLPPGVYVSYYQAMFLNGARETAPDTWDDKKLNKHVADNFGLKGLPLDEKEPRRWCDTVGLEKKGIRSIISPSLATRIGHLFDMVILDEAHVCCNLSANVTKSLIRLQPKYRWALTATPIPNIVSNLFSLMGWIAVPGWYKGEIRNAAWPYARHELGKFEGVFLSQERDYTQERLNKAADPKWSGTCTKVSPVISSPARLLKLLKPSMAYIGKEQVNPRYIKPKVIDVRVPMGKEQSKLYAHYLNRGNIPARHPLVRARKQVAWLRNICADPAGFTHGTVHTPKVGSNMNPKVIAILELTRDILREGEQVVIVNSRLGLTNTLQQRLVEAGVPIARIDSTTTSQHAYQSNLFKRGKARVMLMGIKCAAAYSFDQCKYLIIGSLEYSPGPLNQASGRIDRVTNAVEKAIYCILHKDSIEEIMFDVVATKDDAATICLKGQRTPREFKPVDPGEILATALDRFDLSGSRPEQDCESEWPKLRDAIAAALTN